MKNYAKVIGFSFLLLFFCSFQSNTLAEDSFSPGSDWQEIPAYGPELHFLANWQGTSADNTAENDVDVAETLENTTTAGLADFLNNIYDSISVPSGIPFIGDREFMREDIRYKASLVAEGPTTDNILNYPRYAVKGDHNVFGIAAIQNNTGTPSNSSSNSVENTTTAGLADLLLGVTADFDHSKWYSPLGAIESKLFSPLVIDTDRSGTIALDGGVIQFDIAPHLAGLETILVPAPGKDMFLVWDKAGTETIEGAEREYKEGEIVDITELFGPEDYSRSDFSKLAYTDDGFTKLRKLCDVDNDGDVDKDDTALSAEVAAKLKLWSPLSGELVLFKDSDIIIDARAGSYERHPSRLPHFLEIVFFDNALSSMTLKK